MYENCDCFKLHDIILAKVLDPVFTLLHCYQTASFLIPEGHFNRKNYDFGQLVSAVT